MKWHRMEQWSFTSRGGAKFFFGSSWFNDGEKKSEVVGVPAENTDLLQANWQSFSHCLSWEGFKLRQWGALWSVRAQVLPLSHQRPPSIIRKYFFGGVYIKYNVRAYEYIKHVKNWCYLEILLIVCKCMDIGPYSLHFDLFKRLNTFGKPPVKYGRW